MQELRYVAIGDSFSEGVGDEDASGNPRGWADLVAQGWARSLGQPIQYANLAIRGKLAWPIVQEQLEPALALRPTHLSFNGGGNDMLRPRTTIEHIVDAFEVVARRCREEGVTLILLSGANPARQLPLGSLIQRRGDALSAATQKRLLGATESEHPVLTSLNWEDRELTNPDYWSPDRLHMGPRGHHRVAARTLAAVGAHAPDEWWSLPIAPARGPRGAAYYREHVGPWIGRRLTRRSSGDGRQAKYGSWIEIDPAVAAF